MTDKKNYLFVGLGNPGPKYEKTRHNIGFMVIQEIVRELGWPLKEEKRFQALVARGVVEGVNVHLILPMTYMNESGRSVRSYLDFFQLNAQDIVVVTDDVAIGFGEIRLRIKGSSGGHNGLKSVQQHIGTQDYVRLRMGVGAPKWPGEDALANYVLSTFSTEEREELAFFIDRGANTLKRLLTEDITRVMNEVNTKEKKKSPTEGQENKNEQRTTESL